MDSLLAFVSQDGRIPYQLLLFILALLTVLNDRTSSLLIPPYLWNTKGMSMSLLCVGGVRTVVLVMVSAVQKIIEIPQNMFIIILRVIIENWPDLGWRINMANNIVFSSSDTIAHNHLICSNACVVSDLKGRRVSTLVFNRYISRSDLIISRFSEIFLY